MLGHGYDHNFVINRKGAGLVLAARRLRADKRARARSLNDAARRAVLYGKFPRRNGDGKAGPRLQAALWILPRDTAFPGFAEPSGFSETILKPGEKFQQTTVFKFSTK